jgi:hypothetical protein
MLDPDRLLVDTLLSHPRLLFYPSSGPRCISNIMAVDCDAFVFADYGPSDSVTRRRFWDEIEAEGRTLGKPLTLVASTVRTRVFRVGEKLGLLFFQDNHEVLERIRLAGRVIHCFVGINDGCREGGNYECIHSRPFLHAVLSTSAQNLVYVTDHSEYLGYHTSFRPRLTVYVSDDEGYEFSLNSVYVKHKTFPIQGSEFYVHMINGLFRRTSYLPAFERYRSVWNHPVIAHHDVTRRRCDIAGYDPTDSPKTAQGRAKE